MDVQDSQDGRIVYPVHPCEKSTMERLTLTARIEQEDTGSLKARFVARIEGPESVWGQVRGEGDSPGAAQEELVQAMLSWISNRDCSDTMAGALAEAGFPEIDDDTELELEFAPVPEIAEEPPDGSAP